MERKIAYKFADFLIFNGSKSMDKYNIKLCSREEVGGGGENIHLINACGKKIVDIHTNKGLGHYIELYFTVKITTGTIQVFLFSRRNTQRKKS